MPSDSGCIGQLCFRTDKCGQHRSHIGLAVLRAPTTSDLQGGADWETNAHLRGGSILPVPRGDIQGGSAVGILYGRIRAT